MLKHKLMWKVLRIFGQESSNNDFGLTLTLLMAMSNLLSGLLYGKSDLGLILTFITKMSNMAKC